MRPILMVVLLGSVCTAASTAPAESELIEVRKDEMLRVEVSGRGPLLVLIPGLMGSAYGFMRIVGPLQEAGFRVAVVEPLGIGGSTLRSRSADPRWVTDEVVSGYMAGPSRDLGATLRAYGRMANAREPELLVPHLPSIRCPVRLVIGTATREGGISEAEVEQLEQSLPSFAVETVRDAGHFVFEEKPLTVVAAVERTVGSPARVARSLR
jgi:pimeloyl-ACP methyl ester carboxylesterase